MSEFNVQADLYQALAAVRQTRGCQWDTDKRCGVCEESLRRAEALLEDVTAELAEEAR